MKELLPYLVTLLSTITAGLLSYFGAIRKTKNELIALKESNRFEIEKLMNQHKLDLEALERKHEMEVEKINLDHEHKLELLRKESENAMGASMLGSAFEKIMESPEAKQAISNAFMKKANK